MKMISLLILICFFLTGCDTPEEIQKLKEDKISLTQQVKNLNKQLSECQQQISAYQQQIKIEKTPQQDLTEKINELTAKYEAELKKCKTEYSAQIAQLNKEKTETAVLPALLPLQLELKERAKIEENLKADLHELRTKHNQLCDIFSDKMKEVKEELDNKASYHHMHWK